MFFYLLPAMVPASKCLLRSSLAGRMTTMLLLPAYSRCSYFKRKQALSPLGLSRVCPAKDPFQPLLKPLQRDRASSEIHCAAFSAIIRVGELVLPLVIKGITPASTTRKPAMPCTRRRESTTAMGSLA
jgi:hypothetical protein